MEKIKIKFDESNKAEVWFPPDAADWPFTVSVGKDGIDFSGFLVTWEELSRAMLRLENERTNGNGQNRD